MPGFIVLALLSAFLNGHLAVLFFLLTALEIILRAAQPALGVVQHIEVVSLALSVPLSAQLAAALISKFSFGKWPLGVLTCLTLTFSFLYAIDSGYLSAYFDAILNTLNAKRQVSPPLLLAGIGSSVVFCGGLCAFCFMILTLAFEIPFNWFMRGRALAAPYVLASLRPVAIWVFLSIALNQILGLFSSELWPNTIISHILN